MLSQKSRKILTRIMAGVALGASLLGIASSAGAKIVLPKKTQFNFKKRQDIKNKKDLKSRINTLAAKEAEQVLTQQQLSEEASKKRKKHQIIEILHRMCSIEKYTYRIEWSEQDNTHIAKCLEFPSLMAHGKTTELALREIETVVDESINWLMEDKQQIPEPLGLKKYKGNLTLRIPPEIHRELAIKSAEEGISINKFILSKL